MTTAAEAALMFLMPTQPEEAQREEQPSIERHSFILKMIKDFVV